MNPGKESIMAKIKNQKELINFAKNLGIDVSNKSLKEIGESAINVLSESLQENHITDYIAVNKENRKIKKNIEEINNVLAYDDPKGCCVLYTSYGEDINDSLDTVFFVGTKEQCEEYVKEGSLGDIVVSHKSDRIKAMVDEFIANQNKKEEETMETTTNTATETVKEEITMKKNNITTINHNETIKEKCAMETTNTTVTNNNNNTTSQEEITMRTLPIATTDTRIIHCVQGILIDSAKVGISEQEVLRMVQGILIDAPKLGLDNNEIIKKITETFKNMINKEEETDNTQATINNVTEVKEECLMMTLEELVNALANNQKVQDAGYIDKDTLRDILNNKETFNMGFNNRATRKEMVAVVMRMYKDSLRVADEIAYGNMESEFDSVKDKVNELVKETTQELDELNRLSQSTKDENHFRNPMIPKNVPIDNNVSFRSPLIPNESTHQVICTDHAYYDDEFIAFKGTEEQCEEYADIHNYIDDETGIASYKVESLEETNTQEITEADIEADDKEQIEIHELMHNYQVPTIEDVWNQKTAEKVLIKILETAKKNNYICFISCHMVKSIIREVLIGKPTKEVIKLNNSYEVIENTFTNDQDKFVNDFIDKFANDYLIKNEKGTGYTIRAVGMAWYYKKVVYKFQNKERKLTAKYEVDFKTKTVTRIGSKLPPVTLDNAAFKILDDICTFVRVCK